MQNILKQTFSSAEMEQFDTALIFPLMLSFRKNAFKKYCFILTFLPRKF